MYCLEGVLFFPGTPQECAFGCPRRAVACEYGGIANETGILSCDIGNEDFVVIGKSRTCCGVSFTCDAGVDRHVPILLGIGRDGRVVVIAGCDKEGQ